MSSWLGAVLGILAVAGAQSASASALRDADCLLCHQDNTLTRTNAEGRVVSLFVDVAKFNASVHRTNTCASCHSDLTDTHPDESVPARPVNCANCHERPAASYAASVHGQAAQAGNRAAPTCEDCHGSHTVLPPGDPASPLHFSNLAKTCGQCHVQESDDVQASVHGRAVAAGAREAATCIDCHSEHQIEQLKTNATL